MEKNKVPSLLWHKGGRYYGRFSLGGKTKFMLLHRMLPGIAGARFAGEKAKRGRMFKC